MRFEAPLFLLLTPAVMLVVLGLAWWAERRRLRLAAAWSAALGAAARRGRRYSVPLLALVALGAALGAAGPRGGRAEQLAESQGLNVLFAIDISRSMLAEDADPNRLRRAVREARRLLQDLPGDRAGLLGFAGQSYVLVPLTLDHSAVDMYLESLDPELASAGGSNVGAALRQARQVLNGSPEGGDRALVLFTDGEAHDSVVEGVQAARELERDGVRLVVVGEGGTRPARIPLHDASGTVVDYKRDTDGSIVETWRRDDILQAIATASDGVLIPADLPDQAGAVRDVLRGLARRPIRERRLADLQPLAWVAALLAALLLVLHTGSRRTLALSALAGLALLPTRGNGQGASRGQRLLETGRLEEAEAAFRREALRGEGGDTAWFNAGTAALAAGRLDEARDALGRAVRTVDPGLRFRALYNLGLSHLLAVRRDSTGAAARREEAIAALREALLLRPHSLPTKWNLELLLRQPPPSSGGGGSQQPQGGTAEQDRGAGSGLSPSEAEALLTSVERSELATRLNALQRQRLRGGAARKDW